MESKVIGGFMKQLFTLFVTALVSGSVVSVFGSIAEAKTMNCTLGVYTAQMLAQPDLDFGTNSQMISVPRVDKDGNAEVTVGGQIVAVNLIKKPYTDLYDITFALTTPVADRVGRSHILAMLSDGLYNDGPTSDSGWDLTPGPGHEVFKYYRYPVGAFSYTAKLVNAMKAAGVWKTGSFTSAVVDLNNMTDTMEFVKAQLDSKKLQPDDVLGLASFLSCTRVP